MDWIRIQSEKDTKGQYGRYLVRINCPMAVVCMTFWWPQITQLPTNIESPAPILPDTFLLTH
jgi:hypothetical protein